MPSTDKPIVLIVDGRTMHLKQYWRSCGLAHCRFCNRTDGSKWRSHGPYWVGWYVGGDSDKKAHYFGRTLPLPTE